MVKLRRNDFGENDKPSSSILIIDTAADQCTCGGSAWIVLDKTGEEIRCNGYLKGKNHFFGPVSLLCPQ